MTRKNILQKKKQDQKETKIKKKTKKRTYGQNSLGKNPRAVKWISGKQTLVFGIRKAWPPLFGACLKPPWQEPNSCDRIW